MIDFAFYGSIDFSYFLGWYWKNKKNLMAINSFLPLFSSLAQENKLKILHTGNIFELFPLQIVLYEAL